MAMQAVSSLHITLNLGHLKDFMFQTKIIKQITNTSPRIRSCPLQLTNHLSSPLNLSMCTTCSFIQVKYFKLEASGVPEARLGGKGK